MTVNRYECWNDDEEAPEPGMGRVCVAISHSLASEVFAYDEMDGCDASMHVAVRSVGDTNIQVFEVRREVEFRSSRDHSRENHAEETTDV